MVPIVSVAGITALLQEPEPELQTQALSLIDRHVNQFWIELADYVSVMYVPLLDRQLMSKVRCCTKTQSSPNGSWPHWSSQR
jgi:hypothetical protein